MKKLLLFIFILFASALIPATQAHPVDVLDAERGPVIRYYPNPIRSVMTLEVQLEYINQYSSVEVKIVNILGQQMIPSTTVDLTGLNNEIKIDLTDVPSGVYFLEVYSNINGNSVKQTRKITKN